MKSIDDHGNPSCCLIVFQWYVLYMIGNLFVGTNEWSSLLDTVLGITPDLISGLMNITVKPQKVIHMYIHVFFINNSILCVQLDNMEQ